VQVDPDDAVIVLGERPRADDVWHVSADGVATGTSLPEPRRLCTLDLQAATDLLALVRARHAPAPPADIRRPTGNAVPRRPEPVYAAAGHLTLLGGCELTVSGTPVRLRRTAALQILAYLAVHPRGATRAELTQAVWPHLPAATIAGRLHTTLTDLRKQLHPLLRDEPVTRHEDRYQLNTRAIGTDLQTWTAAADALTHAVGTTAQQGACRALLEQYRGHLADGHTWPWLTPAREQIRRTVIEACATLAEHSDPDEALTWLRRAITIDPNNEPLHRQTAHLLHAAGDHTGAAELIQRLHRRLNDAASTPP
jgi:two-component SAPR family response regulator